MSLAASTVTESRRLAVGIDRGGTDEVAIVKTSTVGDEKSRNKVKSLSRTQQFVEKQDLELCSLIDSLISGSMT